MTNPADCEGCVDVREGGGSTCGDCGTFLPLASPATLDGVCRLGVFCERHGFTHGGEAEQLRAELERILSTEDGDVPTWAIRRVLDRVDARDSLAYLEAKRKEAVTGAEFVAAAQKNIEPRSDEEIREIIADVASR